MILQGLLEGAARGIFLDSNVPEAQWSADEKIDLRVEDVGNVFMHFHEAMRPAAKTVK